MPHFGAGSAGHGADNGGDATGHEVGKLGAFIRFVEDFSRAKDHRPEARHEEAAVLESQRSQKQV